MASLIYNSCFADAFKGNINFDSDTFKVALVGAAYKPDKEAHSRRSDITDEVSGNGYSSGGAIAKVEMTEDAVYDRLDISLGSVIWINATITAAGAVYYKSRGGIESAEELVAYIDFGGDVKSTNGPFSLTASTLRIQN